MQPTLTQDPRSIVTPDAFSVHPSLLGTPLANPSRRALAILIDLLVVALVTALTSGFWFILGVVVAAFFFSRATKPGKEGRRSPALRFFLGCMGVTALSFTVVAVVVVRLVNQSGDILGPDGPAVTVGIDGRGSRSTRRARAQRGLRGSPEKPPARLGGYSRGGRSPRDPSRSSAPGMLERHSTRSRTPWPISSRTRWRGPMARICWPRRCPP